MAAGAAVEGAGEVVGPALSRNSVYPDARALEPPLERPLDKLPGVNHEYFRDRSLGAPDRVPKELDVSPHSEQAGREHQLGLGGSAGHAEAGALTVVDDIDRHIEPVAIDDLKGHIPRPVGVWNRFRSLAAEKAAAGTQERQGADPTKLDLPHADLPSSRRMLSR